MGFTGTAAAATEAGAKGAEGAGAAGAGAKGAEAAGAGTGLDFLGPAAGGGFAEGTGFATAADLTAAGAGSGFAEGTGFATAADFAAPATAAGLPGFSSAFEFGPSTGEFASNGLDAFAQAPGGNTLPGSNTNTFGAPSSGVLDTPGAAAPSPASATGLQGTGVTPSPLSLDPTGAAGDFPAGAAGTGGANAGSSFSLENLVTGAGKQITSNPLGTALAAGGLGFNILKGQQQSEAQKKLAEQAGNLNAQGQQLASYLLNGNLPPGLKTSLDAATSAAKARVRSNFAARGLSTDPSKNSALAQELQMIDEQAVITTAQIGQQLLGSGQAASGLSSQVYQTLAKLDQTQTDAIGKAVANFASALSGGSKGSGGTA